MCDSSSLVRHRSRPNHRAHMPGIFHCVPSADIRRHAVSNTFGIWLGRDRDLVGWRNDRNPAGDCCAGRQSTEAICTRPSAVNTNAIDLHGRVLGCRWCCGLCLGRSATIVRIPATACHASALCRGLVGAQCLLCLRILGRNYRLCGGLRQTGFSPCEFCIAKIIFRTLPGKSAPPDHR
jgi:hypothetical protein